MKRTHEKIVGLWTLTANVEKLEQIPELSVNVTTYLTGVQSQYITPAMTRRTVTGESTT